MPKLAEEKGFEPLAACAAPVFKTCGVSMQVRVLAAALGWSAVASACVYAGPSADDEPRAELAVHDDVDASEYVEPVEAADEPCPAIDAEPEPDRHAPTGAYCTSRIGWTFHESGVVELYTPEAGLVRGYVLHAGDTLVVAWPYACDGGELGDGVPVCERIESWTLTVTEDAVVIGGVKASRAWC